MMTRMTTMMQVCSPGDPDDDNDDAVMMMKRS